MIYSGPHNALTDVPGFRVGNAEDRVALTGVTVVLPYRPAVAAVDVRGGDPGTRETDALDPSRLVETVDAVVLSGGSAFGLAAADAAMGWLTARGRGFRVGDARVPIVPAAVIFDLANGGDKAWGEGPALSSAGADRLRSGGGGFRPGQRRRRNGGEGRGLEGRSGQRLGR